MKRLFIVLLIVYSSNLLSQEVYQIEGQIRGVTDGECILAYNHYSSQLFAKDTAQVDKNGKVIFSKKES